MITKELKVLIIGVGSIGERHVKNLLSLGLSVSVFDLDENLKKEVAQKYGVPAIFLLEESLKSFNLVLICTSTHTHVALAAKALSAGCHVFIEKPIAEKTSAELEALNLLANKSQRITLVGCNMRFHRGVQEIKKIMDFGTLGKIYSVRAHFGHYLPNWRKVDYRKTYSVQKAQGGGILLECVHEFDYLRWLFGDINNVSAQLTRSGALAIDGEDQAEVFFQFKNGMTGHLHADCLQQTKRRGCEIIGEKGTFIWESLGKNPEIAAFTLLRKNGEPLETKAISIEMDEMYLTEMQHLLDLIRDKDELIENKQQMLNSEMMPVLFNRQRINDITYAIETLRLVEMAQNYPRMFI